ncbi:YaiI/YqxD family protein [Natronospora cellulosivora (SeqCode)]
MRILVDGDACPVINECEKLASDFDCELIIYTDLAHQIKSKIGQVIVTDTATQSVDMLVYNNAKKNDIIITQDYGLAALVLGKKTYVINHFGNFYNDENIDYLLMLRHHNSKIRRAGKKHPGFNKRTDEDNKAFYNTMFSLLKKHINRKED